MKTVIYTSNTGVTEKYAYALADGLGGLPCYSLAKAPKVMDDEVIYLGWIMAGTISGLSDAMAAYKIAAICAVGMMPESTEKMMNELREKNAVAVPLFYLPGGFQLKKLSGMYRMMMGMLINKLKSDIKKKENKTEADDKALAMFTDGMELYDEKNLEPVFEALR